MVYSISNWFHHKFAIYVSRLFSGTWNLAESVVIGNVRVLEEMDFAEIVQNFTISYLVFLNQVNINIKKFRNWYIVEISPKHVYGL